MLFVLQLQHFALHELAPALLAWAAPSTALGRGLPRFAQGPAARVLPIPAVADQQLGGAIKWVLGAILFAVVFFIVLGRNLEREEAALDVRRLARQS